MDKFKVISVLAVLVLAGCNSTPKNNISNYNANGNLESPKPSGCVSINQLTNQQNPVDIFTGLSTCMVDKNYSKAAELYFAGMSYGFFDRKRVSDKTAHQAISVLRMNVFNSEPEEAMDKLQVALDRISSDNTDVCKSLTNLGSPAYKPTYMIQHGMGAFTGQSTEDGLVENFNSSSAWKDSLATIAKCV